MNYTFGQRWFSSFGMPSLHWVFEVAFLNHTLQMSLRSRSCTGLEMRRLKWPQHQEKNQKNSREETR